MPEQLLMVLEAALLGHQHPAILIGAIHLFTATATALRRRGCLNAAGGVLLPPVLHLLSLALQHALQHPQQLLAEAYDLPELRDSFAALVAMLLQAAGVNSYQFASVHACGMFMLPTWEHCGNNRVNSLHCTFTASRFWPVHGIHYTQNVCQQHGHEHASAMTGHEHGVAALSCRLLTQDFGIPVCMQMRNVTCSTCMQRYSSSHWSHFRHWSWQSEAASHQSCGSARFWPAAAWNCLAVPQVAAQSVALTSSWCRMCFQCSSAA
jgi:hypothetical protein